MLKIDLNLDLDLINDLNDIFKNDKKNINLVLLELQQNIMYVRLFTAFIWIILFLRIPGTKHLK